MYLSYIPGRPFSPPIAAVRVAAQAVLEWSSRRLRDWMGLGSLPRSPRMVHGLLVGGLEHFFLVNLWSIMLNTWNNNIISGWWFGTRLLFFHMLGIINNPK